MKLYPAFLLLATAAAQGDWRPLAHVDYDKRDGIYLLTYGSTTNSPVFERKIEAALAMSYIRGVAHYQEWRTFEPSEGVYDWRQLDHVFRLARRHGKYVILGVQAGVMAPEWFFRRRSVRTFDFLHNNPGWTAWSTVKIPATAAGQPVTLSRMAVPWDPEYNAALEKMLRQIAERYDGDPRITFINVCGPSASGGVEANFNVNWKLSREANPGFDRDLAFTLAKYTAAWKAAIDMHLKVFPKSDLGVGLHDETGSSGFDRTAVVSYPAAAQMHAARAIRDYFLERHAALKRARGVVRNCGLSISASWWGDPDRPGSRPASNFTALQWEVRDRARIGYESASVNSLRANLPPDGFRRVVRNGINGYGRYLEFKVPDIVRETADDYGPYEPYRAILEEAARILSPGARR